MGYWNMMAFNYWIASKTYLIEAGQKKTPSDEENKWGVKMLKKLCKNQVFHSQKNKIAIVASFINAGGELISRF